MASLKNLLAQKSALDRAIALARNKEKAEVIRRIKALMDEYGLTAADLSGKTPARSPAGRKASAAKGVKVAPKYRNKETGETWSGRGLQPKWLKAALASGRKIEEFAI